MYVCVREKHTERERKILPKKDTAYLYGIPYNSHNMIKLWNIAPIPQSRDKMLIDFNEILLHVKII